MNLIKGAIAGDIIGSIYEFKGQKERDILLFGLNNHFTDDTVLTIATADVLLNKGDYSRSYLKYARENPDQAWGIRFKSWYESENPAPYNSFGNGSAMRVAPIGWYFNNIQEVLFEAEKSSSVTHNHPEGIKGAQAVASAIFLARSKASKTEIKDFIENNFSYDLSKSYNEIQPYYVYSESCQKSVPESIICFLDGNDFEDTIRNAIGLGGDADTQAAIAGSIAEAYFGGVPENIWKKCERKLTPEFKDIINNFYNKIN